MCLILSYQCWIIVELSFQGQMFFHTPPTPTAYGYMVLKIVVTTLSSSTHCRLLY